MARYKTVDRSPKFIPVVLDAQIQRGSFEYALDYLVGNEIDLSALHARSVNVGCCRTVQAANLSRKRLSHKKEMEG